MLQSALTADDHTRTSGFYRWGIVGLLLLVSIFGYVDRLVLSFLIDPIKLDLGLSDKEAGMINGLAFALFYVLMGIPMGRLVDSLNRGRLLSACVAVSSLMTAACSAATNFAGFFIARMGVGAGEAALNPAAISLISDLFPKDRVARPIGLFSLGVYFGGGAAIMLGGKLIAYLESLDTLHFPLVGEIAAWRAVFLIVGLPGVLLALVILPLVRDSRRVAGRRDPAAHASLGQCVAYLKANTRFYLFFFGALVAYGFNIYGLLAWFPVMLMRTYGAGPGDIAWSYGSIYLMAGVAGGLAVGTITGWLQKRYGEDAPMLLSLGSVALMLAASVAAPLMPTMTLCLALTAVTIFTWALTTGTSFIAIAIVAPPAMRGLVTGIYMVIMNITGGAFAALFVGALSDDVFGPENIRYSMVTLAMLSLPLAMVLFHKARASYRDTLAAGM